jgi:Outer membrane efflux protein
LKCEVHQILDVGVGYFPPPGEETIIQRQEEYFNSEVQIEIGACNSAFDVAGEDLFGFGTAGTNPGFAKGLGDVRFGLCASDEAGEDLATAAKDDFGEVVKLLTDVFAEVAGIRKRQLGRDFLAESFNHYCRFIGPPAVHGCLTRAGMFRNHVAAFFPQLLLGAEAGFEGRSIMDWLNWPNRFWAVGPTMLETVFDGGRRRAIQQSTQFNYDALVATYRQSALDAFQQVEDNLAALRVLEQETATQKAAVNAAERSLQLSTNRYTGGLVTYLEVVAAQARRWPTSGQRWIF